MFEKPNRPIIYAFHVEHINEILLAHKEGLISEQTIVQQARGRVFTPSDHYVQTVQYGEPCIEIQIGNKYYGQMLVLPHRRMNSLLNSFDVSSLPQLSGKNAYAYFSRDGLAIGISPAEKDPRIR